MTEDSMNKQVIEKIVNELGSLNEERVNEVYQIVHKFYQQTTENKQEKLLDFAGLFEDMDVNEFVDEIYKRRLNNSRRDIL